MTVNTRGGLGRKRSVCGKIVHYSDKHGPTVLWASDVLEPAADANEEHWWKWKNISTSAITQTPIFCVCGGRFPSHPFLSELYISLIDILQADSTCLEI